MGASPTGLRHFHTGGVAELVTARPRRMMQGPVPRDRCL